MKQPKIIVAGIGPGSEADITGAVLNALREADVVVGYKYYFQFVKPFLQEGAQCVDTGMKKERERAEQAFNLAEEGKTVVVISSGDAGIYGMTPLIYEMKKERNSDVEVVASEVAYSLQDFLYCHIATCLEWQPVVFLQQLWQCALDAARLLIVKFFHNAIRFYRVLYSRTVVAVRFVRCSIPLHAIQRT